MNMNQTIESLRGILNDPNCEHMNKSNVKGYLGELIVKNKLEGEGVNVLHKGNQCGYDLEFQHKNTTFKIDVKLSTLKMELGREVWGWALLHENKSKPITCSHFICVALNKQFKEKYYFIIAAKDIKLFPSADHRGTGQFSKVKYCFMHLPRIKKTFSKKIYDGSIVESYKLLSQNIVYKVESKKDILKYLTNQSSRPRKLNS